MLRMSKFINRIYLACFGPVQNGQNTKIVKQNFCQKCSECQNLFVEIERVKHILASYKMGKKLGISFKHNFCQKCWKCQNLSLKFFGGYPCFGTIQNGQNTKIFSNKSFLYSHAEIFFKNAQNVEIYQGNKSGVTKFFTHTKWPIFTMLKSIRGRNLVLRGFSPIQNDKNSCENFQTEYFFKHPQKVKIYQGNKSGVTKFFTHTKWTILKLEIFSKMLRTPRFIRGINLGLWSFSPIQNNKNSCENFQAKNFFKNDQNVEIYQGNKFGVRKSFTHTNCQNCENS